MTRVLLIEDEELVRHSLRQVLENVGHEVFEACDGNEGLEQFKMMATASQTPDVVVTDIIMAEKDGYETISEIHKIAPDAKIIAISGGGGSNPTIILEASKILGAEHILSKPFSSREFLDAVDGCLN